MESSIHASLRLHASLTGTVDSCLIRLNKSTLVKGSRRYNEERTKRDVKDRTNTGTVSKALLRGDDTHAESNLPVFMDRIG